MNEVFTFIDASHLISKSTLWKERDEAIKEKHDKLNNDNLIHQRQTGQFRLQGWQ